MSIRTFLDRLFLVLLLASLLLSGLGSVQAQDQTPPAGDQIPARQNDRIKVTQEERQAAADRAETAGLALPQAGTEQMAPPGSVPHYYGPYPNYANSPLRMSDAVITITGDGTGATATATVDPATGTILTIDVTNPGSGYTAASVGIASLGVGTGAQATANVVGGQVASITVTNGGTGYVTLGIRKFVDTLPGLGPSGANNLGNYIPVAVADTTTYSGSDYYEIAVVEYTQQMHSDLPPTKLRGYVQLSTSVVPGLQLPLFNPDGSPILLPNGSQALGVDRPYYLGPTIVSTKNKPVRILFRNLLPTGQGGNLFIPVDVTVMGSGMGPNMGGMPEMDPQRPMCGMLPKSMDCYTENRATLHLHGGITPWISDGTAHQWTTPASETTPYPEGVSVSNVPDMPDPGPGAITFFYTNQQSARLLFYHDHAWGITRLNVYAGEAAGYLITDPVEQSLVSQGLIPADQIPLIVQDKTFVPPEPQLAVEDPTWDIARWGGFGQLWVPHVYVPAQNPGDSSGVNQFGRWAYGPWFWPPTSQVDFGPINNPYYCGPDGLAADGVTPCAPACDPQFGWCEPLQIPGVPYLSMGMEAFNDTPLVNGVAYPTTTIDPKAYRFRILNAANDRFFNLQFYVANPAAPTEVALNAAEVAAALDDPAGVFPTPDTAISPAGPSWIQIGTEGGFLPAPVVIPPQVITWVTDPTVFNAGNVDKHSLLLGPAERADVIVDFSAFAGQTLILYNDAPAAFPARDPRYDYYTGNADLTSTGGAPSTPPGYGPNTRTVMQIHVNAAPVAPTYNLAALQTAFLATSLGGQGVFQTGQNPIIVGQSAYNSAYGTAFRSAAPRDGFVRITDFAFTFNSLLHQTALDTLTMPLQPKAIQDEMGEAFEKEYGRMSGNLGLEAPSAQAGAQNLILYPFVNPATEIIDAIELPVGQMEATPIATADDGTQIWKITHNGVDTHPIHFHLYDVQLINRVGWDGIIRKPDANELGWKDTVRISPLEDTIVALRPILPKAPFGVPDSFRPLNPMMPLGSTAMFNNVDANGDPISPPITNQIVNFGWEYVWHCHILSHEEMDMMRPVSVIAARALPAMPVLTATGTPGSPIALAWTDGTPVTTDPATWGNPAAEIGYRVERAPVTGGVTGAYVTIALVFPNVVAYTDTTTVLNGAYSYRVAAYNAAGDSVSVPVQIGGQLAPPARPTNLTATAPLATQVNLAWTDNSNNESGFYIERCAGSTTCTNFAQIAQVGANVATWSDTTVSPLTPYRYRVRAFNAGGNSGYSNIATITTPAPPPAAPSNLRTTLVQGTRVNLAWNDNSNNESGFRIQRCTGAGCTNFAQVGQVGANSAVWSDTTVTPLTTYRYQVIAFNGGGSSAPSNIITVNTPDVAPLAPSNLRVTGFTRNTISLAWNDNSNNESNFQLQRSLTGTGGWTTIATLPANTTAYTNTGLTPNTMYYYRVRATNAIGSSPWSNIVSQRTALVR